MGLKHFFHSTKADPADPTIIGATKWNADHYYVDAAGAPIGNVGALLLAGAAGALTHLNSVAAGMVLTSAGVGALPVWAAGGVPAVLAVTSLTASSYVAVGTNPAQSGAIRLASNQAIVSRDPDNTADKNLLMAGNNGAIYFGTAPNRMLMYGETFYPETPGTLFLGTSANRFIYGYFAAGFVLGTAGSDSLLSSFGGGLKLSNTAQSVNDAFEIGVLRVMQPGTTAVTVRSGAGSPEGVVAANRGSLFLRNDGAAATTFYVKTTDTVATGWVAK